MSSIMPLYSPGVFPNQKAVLVCASNTLPKVGFYHYVAVGIKAGISRATVVGKTKVHPSALDE